MGRGLPFREAHEVVGSAVKFGVEQGRDLSELTISELRQFNASIDDDVFDVLTLEGSVGSRNHAGGTAPSQVKAAIASALEELGD